MRTAIRLAMLCCATVSAPLGAATIDVSVQNFRYVPNEVTIQVGDTVRWTNNSGIHDVRADDGSFNSGSPGIFTFSRTFNSIGDIRYYCTVHSAPGLDIDTAMNGIVHVQGVTPPPTFAINQGISGSWFEPATAGQGFLLDIEPASRFIFVAWFTYTPPVVNKLGAPEHRWLSAQGNYTADAATNIGIFQTSGGAFDTPRTTTTTQVGTMTLRFTNCTTGTVTYTLPGDGLSGEIPIQRLLPAQALCEMLSPANSSVAEDAADQ